MTFNLKEHFNNFLFVPLGGSNEIGMNLNLYHYQGKWLMVDLGIGFANDHLPGVDVIVPNIDFIMEHKSNLLGIVLTHAHEDHVGGVPYLWRELECPIYATPFTASFLKLKLQEEGLANIVPIHEMNPGSKSQLGPFECEMIPLTHSIPEMQALAIRTEKGTVIHTGDWKIDHAPMVGPQSDMESLQQYGDKGVLAIVCDSTNVFVEGHSGSESDVRESLVNLIKQCEKRVVVTTFASNVARLESIILAAQEAGRVVVMAGRSLWRILEAAQESGYLKGDYELLREDKAMDIPREDVLIICTGCQGEPRAALTKLARGEHPHIRLAPDDTVIFASRVIPGNELRIGWLHNLLVEKGLEVMTERDHFIHVSGHPARDELSHMYQVVRPQIAIPVHGEPRHLHEHVRLAKELQVPETVDARNGSVILLEKGNAGVVGVVDSGYLAVDGTSLIPTDSQIIRTRRKIRDDGYIGATVIVDKNYELVTEPRLVTPGVFDPKEDSELIKAIAEEIITVIEGHKKIPNLDKIAELTRNAIRRVVREEVGKKPVMDVQVIEV